VETRRDAGCIGEHGFVDSLFVGLIVGLLTLGAAATPDVSDIAPADADPTNASSVDFTVTFDESVTGVDTTDFVVDASGLTGASIDAVTGGGTTWTVSVGTGTGDGTLSIDLTDDDSIEDGAGNPLGGTGAGNGDFTAGAAYTVDKTPPSVPTALSPADGAYIDTWTPTLSWEPSSDTGGSGLHLTNRYRYDVDLEGAGCKDDYTLSASYHPTFSSDGVYTWRLYSRDNAGNHSNWTDWHTFTVDTDKPDVTIDQVGGQVDPTNASPVVFEIEFDEPIDGATFTDADVSIGGSATTDAVTVTEFAPNDGTTFRVEIVVSADGTVEPTISAGGIDDLAGNANNASTSIDNSVTYDTDPPGLISFELQSPATSPTNADTLVFRVTFDEDVPNVDIADFDVNSSSTAFVNMITPVSAGVYNVTVTGGDLAGFNGTVGLDLAGGQDVADPAGNPLPAGEPPTDETFTVDNDPPGATDVTENPSVIADADVGDQAFTLTIDFDEPMNTGVAPTVAFPTIGEDPSSTIALDPASAWTNDMTYVARYDVADASEEIDDIDVRVTGARDVAGNAQAQYDEEDVFSIDTENPWISLLTSGTADGYYNVGAAIDVTMTFSESVTLSDGSPQLRVDLDSGATDASLAVPTGVASTNGTYTVSAGENSCDLNVVGITVNGSMRDAAGNELDPSKTVETMSTNNLADNKNITVDTTDPTITWVQGFPSGTQNMDADCSLEFPIEVRVIDDCCIDAGSVVVTPSVTNASLKDDTITAAQNGSNEVIVSGTIMVHSLTGCPAKIEVEIDATDCGGNRNVWTESATVEDEIIPVIHDLVVEEHVVTDDCCEAGVEFSAYVTDQCCIAASEITIIPANPTGNLTIDFDQGRDVTITQNGQGRVDISGVVPVRCMTSCPAIVQVTVEADDCCGNSAMPVSSTASETDPNETGHVNEEMEPIPRDDPRQDVVPDEGAIIDLAEVRLDGFGVYRLLVREDTPARFDVVANDADNCSCEDCAHPFDPCGSCASCFGCCATMTVHEIVKQPRFGTATIEDGEGDCNGGSVIRFAPDRGYVGPDEFTYRIRDACGNVSSGIATVYVETVTAAAVEDVYLTVCADESETFELAGRGLWIDGDDPNRIPFVFEVVGVPAHGVLSGDLRDITYTAQGVTSEALGTATIELTYTPAAGFTGHDSATIRFADPFGGFTDAWVDIEVVVCAAPPDGANPIPLAAGKSLPVIVPSTFALVVEAVTLVGADGTTVSGALNVTWDETVGRFVLVLDGGSLTPGTYVLTLPLGNGETVELTIEVCAPDL